MKIIASQWKNLYKDEDEPILAKETMSIVIKLFKEIILMKISLLNMIRLKNESSLDSLAKPFRDLLLDNYNKKIKEKLIGEFTNIISFSDTFINFSNIIVKDLNKQIQDKDFNIDLGYPLGRFNGSIEKNLAASQACLESLLEFKKSLGNLKTTPNKGNDSYTSNLEKNIILLSEARCYNQIRNTLSNYTLDSARLSVSFTEDFYPADSSHTKNYQPNTLCLVSDNFYNEYYTDEKVNTRSTSIKVKLYISETQTTVCNLVETTESIKEKIWENLKKEVSEIESDIRKNVTAETVDTSLLEQYKASFEKEVKLFEYLKIACNKLLDKLSIDPPPNITVPEEFIKYLFICKEETCDLSSDS